MYLASKKYSLAMSALALSSPHASDRQLAPTALFSATNMDHLAGSAARLRGYGLLPCGRVAAFRPFGP
jgi:hypothetical protein